VSDLPPDVGLIELDLPDGAELVHNWLNVSPDVSDLLEDISAARLPNGLWVDLGWYPSFDPTGYYAVQVIDPDREDPLACERTTDPYEAARLFEEMARRFIDGGPTP
jgi:hypothetical protein